MPDWNDLLRARLSGLRLDPAREIEIVEELSQHLDQRYQDLLAEGHDPGAAVELAKRELLDAGTLTGTGAFQVTRPRLQADPRGKPARCPQFMALRGGPHSGAIARCT